MNIKLAESVALGDPKEPGAMGVLCKAPNPADPWAPHPTLPFKEDAWTGGPGIFVDDDGSKYLFYTYESAANGGHADASEGQISTAKLVTAGGPPKWSSFDHATIGEEAWSYGWRQGLCYEEPGGSDAPDRMVPKIRAR